MTYKDVLILQSAYQHLATGFSEKPENPPVPYKLSGKNRLVIAKNNLSLKKVIEVFESAKEQVISQNGGPFTDEDVNKENYQKAVVAVNELLTNDAGDLKLEVLNVEELVENDNPIPTPVLEIFLSYNNN